MLAESEERKRMQEETNDALGLKDAIEHLDCSLENLVDLQGEIRVLTGAIEDLCSLMREQREWQVVDIQANCGRGER